MSLVVYLKVLIFTSEYSENLIYGGPIHPGVGSSDLQDRNECYQTLDAMTLDTLGS